MYEQGDTRYRARTTPARSPEAPGGTGWLIALMVAAMLLVAPPSGQAARVKDLASVAGVRSNQLIGYGLVVGLDGTGDQTSQAPFTVQSLKSMLAKFGVTVPENVNPQLANVAAVSVHADLPAFAKPGQKIDITVSSIGNADSLRGGSLLMTELKGADGRTYAVAQGNVVVSGLDAEGADGSSITVNVPSAGRIPNGATVERAVPSSFSKGSSLVFNLHQADFTTAKRVAEAINGKLGQGTAQPLDGASIQVRAPADKAQRVAFASVVENVKVNPAAAPARVIVNSRTGTVVIGQKVRVDPAAVSHGSLTVTISEGEKVSQPQPFGQGETRAVPQSDVQVAEESDRMFVFERGVNLNEIVKAVNEVGAAPSDLVAILEALEQAGALHAQLIVI